MTELRVYLPIQKLQPQFAAYLATPLRARGYPPYEGQNSFKAVSDAAFEMAEEFAEATVGHCLRMGRHGR